MTVKTITTRSIQAFTCPTGKSRDFMWDDKISGFGLMAMASGHRSFVIQWRSGGRSRRVSIGEYGRLTVEQGRAKAKDMLAKITMGADPLAEKRAALAARTFGDVASDFMKLHIATKRKSSTYAEYDRILRQHILPAIGELCTREVSRAHVKRLHDSMSGRKFEANRTVKVISAIWNWAEGRDEVSGLNPCRRLEKYAEQGRERYLTSEELASLGDALRTADICPRAVAAIRLLILTGARLHEILDAKWSYVDVERGALFLPDSKTGAKTVYLNAAALEVLDKIDRVDGNPYIIPGQKEGQPKVDLHGPWSRVCAAAGLEGVRVHDLRHSFASIGAGASMGLPIVGKLLGHKSTSTTARYAHLDSDPMHAAANTIGATISAAMGDGNSSAEVVPMRRVK
jgi:integrase